MSIYSKPLAENHFFSQLIYLNTVPAMKKDCAITVGDIADYYIYDPLGAAYLETRFGGIQKEYDHWIPFLRDDAKTYADWRISDILDDNGSDGSGLYASSFISPDGRRIIAFRGSEMLGNSNYRNDYAADLALSYRLPNPQQEKLGDYWSMFPFAGAFSLTGHSLGGNLAVYAAVTAPPNIRKRLDGCHAFNAPGFSGEFIELYKKEIQETGPRIYLYQNMHDPVSSMLLNVTSPLVIASDFVPHELEKPSIADLFYPHSNFMYKTDSEGGFVPSAKGDKSVFCNAIHKLTVEFMKLPVKIREEAARILLGALYAPPSPSKELHFTKESVLRRMAYSDTGSADTAAILYASRMLPDSTYEKLFQQIESDTGAPETITMSRTFVLLLEILRLFVIR